MTNVNNLNDGFGESFKFVIYSIIYSEFYGYEFHYTPFTQNLEHNYDKDPEFLNKKEDLINLINHYPLVSTKYTYHIPCKLKLISFFENNIEWCVKSKQFQNLKTLFKKNKQYTKHGTSTYISIHIRRMNSLDIEKNTNYKIIPGTDIPFDFYIEVIKQLRNIYKNSDIHIYSQGKEEDFKFEDIYLHLNESIEKTFIDFVFSDILVIAPSALSYVAGLLSDGIIYYVNCCFKPIASWIVINGYISSRDRYTFFYRTSPTELIKIYYNVETEQFYTENENGYKELFLLR